ncbi:MAG: reverse transcriptase domain-containing protein [Fuerstiella sp.]
MRIYYSLYDRLLDRRALARAFEKIRRAKGAPGVDGQTIADFESGLLEEVTSLVNELRSRTYQPQPVRRVSIPKPDGGERHLGIPSVRDRVVQQALLVILQPIFDPNFHPSSYGYRPGRSCQQAVAKATMFIRRYGLKHVVDMDLSKCFDRLAHGLILSSLRRRLRAKQLALWKKPGRLIRRLRQVGLRGELQKMRMKSWRTSRSSYASMAISNGFLAEPGLYDLTSVQTGVLPEVI